MTKNKSKFNTEFLYKSNIEKYQAEDIEKKLKSSCIKKIRRKKIISGNVIEEEIYPLWNPQVQNRGKKIEPTSHEQEKINQRNRRKTVERKINCNFGEGDLWITLGFKKDLEPKDYKEAQKHIRNYLASLRRESKKTGQELKYIYVIEKSSKGRYHYHIICNFKDRDIAESKWRFGKYPQARRLKNEDAGIDGLAGYMTKDIATEKNQRNYGWSKNLKSPKVYIADSIITKRKAQKLATDHEELRAYLEKEYTGARIISTKVRFSDYTDGAYISAKLIKGG